MVASVSNAAFESNDGRTSQGRHYVRGAQDKDEVADVANDTFLFMIGDSVTPGEMECSPCGGDVIPVILGHFQVTPRMEWGLPVARWEAEGVPSTFFKA
mmetsp:Transcript_5204/g.7059  ORF Transcript_5204/g.7059 Transcript_5204/m.7059 type:complete len:99 (-) Transcript_5204:261-557(-)